MKKTYKIILSAAALVVGFAGISTAALINGQGMPTDDSNLSGGTVIDFESTGTVNVPSLSLSGVTFTANSDIEVDSDFAGSYNTRGRFHITTHSDYDPYSYRFDFDTSVSAFGFLWGAADYNWTLTAYSGSTMLESYQIAPTRSSNAGDYYGIANSLGMTHATLALDSARDYIFIDNFTYKAGGDPIPEPATLLLFGTGVTGLLIGGRLRRNRK